MSMLSRTNRTDPSPKTTFTPPVCRLEAVIADRSDGSHPHDRPLGGDDVLVAVLPVPPRRPHEDRELVGRVGDVHRLAPGVRLVGGVRLAGRAVGAVERVLERADRAHVAVPQHPLAEERRVAACRPGCRRMVMPLLSVKKTPLGSGRCRSGRGRSRTRPSCRCCRGSSSRRPRDGIGFCLSDGQRNVLIVTCCDGTLTGSVMGSVRSIVRYDVVLLDVRQQVGQRRPSWWRSPTPAGSWPLASW